VEPGLWVIDPPRVGEVGAGAGVGVVLRPGGPAGEGGWSIPRKVAEKTAPPLIATTTAAIVTTAAIRRRRRRVPSRRAVAAPGGAAVFRSASSARALSSRSSGSYSPMDLLLGRFVGQ
jgi:hypothetical protein